MKKLITLTDEQWALMQKLMKEHYQSSVSSFIVSLMSETERNQKRGVGRPRKEDQPEEQDPSERIYQNPDPNPLYKHVGYSKYEIEDYYENKTIPPEAWALLSDLKKK